MDKLLKKLLDDIQSIDGGIYKTLKYYPDTNCECRFCRTMRKLDAILEAFRWYNKHYSLPDELKYLDERGYY